MAGLVRLYLRARCRWNLALAAALASAMSVALRPSAMRDALSAAAARKT